MLLTDFILFFYTIPTRSPENDQLALPPRPPPVAPISRPSPVEPACFRLVVVFFFVVWWQPAYLSSSSRMSPSSPYSSSSSSSPSLLPSRSPNVLARSCGLCHPPSVTPAYFWLVVACKISNGGHLRPLSYYISVIFFVVQFAAPKKEKHPPYTPPRRRMLSVIPPITAANYRLIVVS